uniref:uncharacterized protein LOC122602039 n=1 Tax=Erigeron canadensis TaxID=72917 RepID=UPI001CB95CB6|nr:uncharacterized protein LOC122602039 [Erigeron canadensis]
MGFWNNIGDRAKRIRNDLWTRVPDAVKKMDQVIRVEAVEKLQQHWPDDETRAQIGRFTTTFIKNSARYVVYEGFKHIAGASVVSKLVSDTMREVNRENYKVGIEKATDIVERDMRKSTSQPDNFSQNGNLLSAQNAGGDGEAGILDKDSGKSTLQPDKNGNLGSQNAGGGGIEKTKDKINVLMKAKL